MNGECCMTATMGPEFPGAPMHDYDCPNAGRDRDGEISRGAVTVGPGSGGNGWPTGGGGGGAYPGVVGIVHHTFEKMPMMPTVRTPEELALNVDWVLPDNWRDSMARFRAEGLNDTMLGWLMAVAVARAGLDADSRFRYFCGCCWTQIRGEGRRRAPYVGDEFTDREERYRREPDDSWEGRY